MNRVSEQDWKEEFFALETPEKYKCAAYKNIQLWLTNGQFKDYVAQILALINKKKYNLLLDSFYRIIPFGTGGRRGPVGIGPNRINPWTVQATAQGHATYIKEKYHDIKKLGIVIVYDGRVYPNDNPYDPILSNPVKNLTSKQLAQKAAEVYSANGINVYIFSEPRTTPELSYTIRYLHAIAGINISASHNPRHDNGIKIYAADGGQLVPPHDQVLADTINNVRFINDNSNTKFISIVGKEIDEAFIDAVTTCSLSQARNVQILYSPLHGVGATNIYASLKKLNFHVLLDEKTKDVDGNFSNVTFNIPNPEVPEAFDTCYKNKDAVSCDIIFASDPDADRLGVSVKNLQNWHYLNGNEIGLILLSTILRKREQKLAEFSTHQTDADAIVMKTSVTSSLLTKICQRYNVKIIPDLLVGFKYISNEILKLEEQGNENKFVVGLEESHGYLVGTYARDKDAAGAAIIIAERAAELKQDGKTLIDDLVAIYKEYGYTENALASIIMEGAIGKENIEKIQYILRNAQKTLKHIGRFSIKQVKDYWDGLPHVSKTDTMSRDMIMFELNPENRENRIDAMKITIRPSGTEPKIKIYIEVQGRPIGIDATDEDFQQQKQKLDLLCDEIRTAFLKEIYTILKITMPERGYFLSDLLTVEQKQAYFQIEKDLLACKKQYDLGQMDKQIYFRKIHSILCCFGKNPIEKIDTCFYNGHARYFKDFFMIQ